MPIDFYYFLSSPPCRTVMILAKAIGVHLNMKTIDVLKGEQFKPEFLKMNPQHIIPTIDDNGLILWESRPIMGYLVSKYAKNDSLYPRDPKKRALVDQRLYFDVGTLSERILKCYLPVVFGGANSIREEDLQAVEKACALFNKFLEDQDFVAGDTITIADFSISTSICVLEYLGFDIGRYDNVTAWYNRCKEILDKFGYEEVHAAGMKLFVEMYRANLQESS